ncbi:glucan biosynthesis protein G [Sulfitobacter sp.]|uniref:glucan biosynthesis protein n=1 Tax=Sulfitobacter sp. TaxID=1903071 RepID=UPI00329A64BA
MSRRAFTALTFAGLMPALSPLRAAAQDAPLINFDSLLVPTTGASGSFDSVVQLARTKSQSEANLPEGELSGVFDGLNYDAYRAIRSKQVPLKAQGDRLAFDPMPPGVIYQDPVNIAVIEGEETFDLRFDPSIFTFDPAYFDQEEVSEMQQNPPEEGIGYSGFRMRGPFNRPDVLDEFVVFQGASYFRGVARGLLYGLSARGLAVRTASGDGEEFPRFTNFWIEVPDPGAQMVVVRALLDTPSCTGAFEFEISPGDTTVMQTRCRLFPRREIDQIGIAPLTSMYFFGPSSRAGRDDFRDAVHDSSGLQMITGSGRRLWRSLSNPPTLQISAFSDQNPKGFGLTQRQRDFDYYQDAEARYEKRPSGWVEPVGDWGPGAVILIEIPVSDEFNDNIVAFWRPREPLVPSDEGYEYNYRLHWCSEPPDTAPIGRVTAFRSGAYINDTDKRAVVVDFAKDEAWAEGITVKARANGTEVANVVKTVLPDGKTIRAFMQFDPSASRLTEFELTLMGPNGPESESWVYRLVAE